MLEMMFSFLFEAVSLLIDGGEGRFEFSACDIQILSRKGFLEVDMVEYVNLQDIDGKVIQSCDQTKFERAYLNRRGIRLEKGIELVDKVMLFLPRNCFYNVKKNR